MDNNITEKSAWLAVNENSDFMVFPVKPERFREFNPADHKTVRNVWINPVYINSANKENLYGAKISSSYLTESLRDRTYDNEPVNLCSI